MKTISRLLPSGAWLGLSAHADILELKNGNILNGKYAGGTAGTVRIETSAGQQVVETSQIIALTFTTPPPPPVATPVKPDLGNLRTFLELARFFQIENQLNMVLDLQVAASLPLIR